MGLMREVAAAVTGRWVQVKDGRGRLAGAELAEGR